MNWEAIGAIGEIVGAAGVILSLVYLGVQIQQGSTQTRLNTKAIHARAFQNLVEHQSTLFLSQATNPQVRATMLKARAQEIDDLTLDERVMYGAHTRMIIRSYFNAYNLLKEDLIRDDQWSTLTPSLVRETTRRAFTGWWRLARNDFPAEFAALVDRAMESQTGEV